MIEANGKSPPYFIKRLHEGCAAVACLLLSGIFLSCHPTPKGALDPETVGRLSLPIDADPEFAERLGREALVKIGYLPLLNLARQAGWVTTKTLVSPPGNNGGLLAMDGAVDARGFIDVFSKYAVAAGVASQADSPFPGPGDFVGVGILVIGLVDAGLLAGILLKALGDVASPATSSTTSSPPAVTEPDQDPKPEGDPKTTGPTPPIPPDPPKPKEEKETCEAKRPDLIRCDDPKISDYPFRSENEAFYKLVKELGKGVRKEKGDRRARRGPCVNRGGFHTNVLRGGDYPASIVGCDCCDDSSGKAVQKQRADIVYH